MEFALALIPSIILLIYIYKKDAREKEPFRLLLKCFIFGIIIIIPVLILEELLTEVSESIAVPGSVLGAVLDGFLVAAFSEELFKYFAVRIASWKSKEFNCTFDGIVYAVYVSLGFATFENVLYVLDGGIGTAVMRMFTAVPGHACDAVFMGYYYSKAKKASIDQDKAAVTNNTIKALIIPMLLHGLYDCLISFDDEVAGEAVGTIGILAWFVFVIVEFIFAFKVVNKASKNDTYLFPEEEAMHQALNRAGMVVPAFAMRGNNWICRCRNINNGDVCLSCGAKRPPMANGYNPYYGNPQMGGQRPPMPNGYNPNYGNPQMSGQRPPMPNGYNPNYGNPPVNGQRPPMPNGYPNYGNPPVEGQRPPMPNGYPNYGNPPVEGYRTPIVNGNTDDMA